MTDEMNDLCGIVLVDKPAGITSFSVLRRLKRILNIRKMGHGGTLDPAASGLMVVAIGKATRLLPYFLGGDKAYDADIRFGQRTRSDDAESEVIEEAPWTHIQRADIEAALEKFRGNVMQVPPAFSALHVDGKRAYELARKDVEVRLDPRPVTFYGFDILSYEAPVLRLHVACSGGTYIRSLARDLGMALGSCAHLCGLRRTQSSAFHLENAIELEKIDDVSQVIEKIISPFDVMDKLPAIELENVQCSRMLQGQRFSYPKNLAPGSYRVSRKGHRKLEAIFEIAEDKSMKIHRF